MCAFNYPLSETCSPWTSSEDSPRMTTKKRALKVCTTKELKEIFWSGRWDLNPRQLAWEARTLPLSYARPVRNFNILHDYASWCNFSCVNTVSAPDA